MPSLQVREVPDAIYGALVEASKRDHRSLTQQALLTLEKGLGFSENPRNRRRRLIERIAETPVEGADKLPDPVDLLREDRNR